MSLRKKLLKALQESALPIPTSDLVAAFATGTSHPRSRVCTELYALRRKGQVRRELRRRKGERHVSVVAYWMANTQGEQR